MVVLVLVDVVDVVGWGFLLLQQIQFEKEKNVFQNLREAHDLLIIYALFKKEKKLGNTHERAAAQKHTTTR